MIVCRAVCLVVMCRHKVASASPPQIDLIFEVQQHNAAKPGCSTHHSGLAYKSISTES